MNPPRLNCAGLQARVKALFDKDSFDFSPAYGGGKIKKILLFNDQIPGINAGAIRRHQIEAIVVVRNDI